MLAKQSFVHWIMAECKKEDLRSKRRWVRLVRRRSSNCPAEFDYTHDIEKEDRTKPPFHETFINFYD